MPLRCGGDLPIVHLGVGGDRNPRKQRPGSFCKPVTSGKLGIFVAEEGIDHITHAWVAVASGRTDHAHGFHPSADPSASTTTTCRDNQARTDPDPIADALVEIPADMTSGVDTAGYRKAGTAVMARSVPAPGPTALRHW